MYKKLMTSIICSFIVLNSNTTILTANAVDFAPTCLNSSDPYYDTVVEEAKSRQADDLQKFSEAKNSLEYAIYHMDNGDAKFRLEQYAEAIQDYDKAISLMTGFMNDIDRITNSTSHFGQYFASNMGADKTRDLKHALAMLYTDRGRAKSLLGQKFEAIQDYDKAIELDPSYASVFMYRGIVKFTLGHKVEAIQDYDKAIELNPNIAEVYVQRGWVKVILKQYTEAIKDADKAIEINPNYTEAYKLREYTKQLIKFTNHYNLR